MAGFYDTAGNSYSYNAPSYTGPGAYKGTIGGTAEEQRRYQIGMRDFLTPSSMSYGDLPRAPGESSDAFWARKQALSDAYTGPGIPTGSAALSQMRSKPAPTRSSGGSRGGGGGGGGGGGPVAVIPPTPVEFYLGPAPKLKKLNLDYTEMGKRVQEANLPTIQEYAKFNPNEEATLRSLSQSASDYAAGRIPQSALQGFQRSIAQTGYGTGLGVGGRTGGIQRSFGARDIMQTTMGLQQKAQQMAAAIPQIMQQRYAAQYQISPNQIFDTATSQASINQQLANQQLMMDWMNKPLPGQYDITTGSYVGFGAPGTRVANRPTAPGIGSNYTGAAYNPFG